MVDVVTNHMGYRGSANSVDYSVFNPFNKQSEYHPVCLIEYDSNNQTNLKQVGCPFFHASKTKLHIDIYSAGKATTSSRCLT